MGHRLKICQLVYDHPQNPWCGGGGARRVWAINALLSRRHDITVYCGAFPDAQHQGEPYPVHFTGGSRRYVESRLRFVVDVHRIDPRGFDLFVEEFSYYAPLMPRTGGRPLVTVLEGQHGFKALKWRGVYGLASVFSEFVLLRRRRNVVIVSEHLRSAVHPRAKVAVIGLGTQIPTQMPPATRECALFLGRLDIWHKGIDTLITAWAGIEDGDKRLPLHIVGGGDERALRRLIAASGATRVSVLGRMSNADAMAAINRAAFVVMPSRMEGFGLVAAEALALGKPVVVSAIPSLGMIVPDDVAGIHVPPGDASALAQAIKRLLGDDALLARLSDGARRIGGRYRWEDVAARQERFYYQCLEARR